MINLIVDDLDLLVKENLSIIEVCNSIGVIIPRFCYHELLPTAGNCRMCLVEVDVLNIKDETLNDTKLFAACTTEIEESMVVTTCSELILKTRENIIELLLLNHPLDCPICDQAGECDLQDQSKIFGSHKSKFFFNRRAVSEKILGPVIKTIMTRCIHCTRCVRFFSEVEGVPFLGTFNRGTSTEIGNYVFKNINSEISGNVIDLCPVGALTSNVYAFQARPWELSATETLDVSDSLGANVFLYSRDSEIYRVLPKQNNEINKSIISDKTRFSFDFNKNNRINNIYIKKNSEFIKIKWESFLPNIKEIVNNKRILFYVDENLDLINLNLLKTISYSINKSISVKKLSYKSEFNNFYSRSLNNRIAILNDFQDLILFFSVNTKKESAVLNTLIKMLKNSNYIKDVISFGLFFSNNLNVKFTNLNSSSFLTILEGKQLYLSDIILKSKPILLIGSNFQKLTTNTSFIINFLKKKLTNISVLSVSKSSNTNGALFLNIKCINSKDIKTFSTHIAINLDDVYKTRKYFKPYRQENLWLNTHFSKLCLKFKFLIPVLTPFEQQEIHLNLENRPQKTEIVSSSNCESRALKSLFLLLSNYEYDKLQNFSYLNYLLEESFDNFLFELNTKSSLSNYLMINEKELTFISNYALKPEIQDFYLTTKNTRNSLNMSSFSRYQRNNFNVF